jgi:primosomal protein N' (replication factor Y)
LRTYAEREQKAAMSRVASVLLPLPLPEAFDYAVEDDLPLAVGDHVAAPLGPRQVRGVVTAVREAQGVNRPLKSILGRLDNAPLPVNTLAFIDWAARYACQPPGEALAMTLRGLRAPPPKPERRLILTGAAPARITPARTRVLETPTGSPCRRLRSRRRRAFHPA